MLKSQGPRERGGGEAYEYIKSLQPRCLLNFWPDTFLACIRLARTPQKVQMPGGGGGGGGGRGLASILTNLGAKIVGHFETSITKLSKFDAYYILRTKNALSVWASNVYLTLSDSSGTDSSSEVAWSWSACPWKLKSWSKVMSLVNEEVRSFWHISLTLISTYKFPSL